VVGGVPSLNSLNNFLFESAAGAGGLNLTRFGGALNALFNVLRRRGVERALAILLDIHLKIEIHHPIPHIIPMRIISFNINGIKSMTGKLKNGEKKGGPTNNVIQTLIEEQQPDVLCLQELKTQNPGDLTWLRQHFPHIYLNLSKHKKGYSGVALLTKEEPDWVETDFTRYSEEAIGAYGEQEFVQEGRIVIAKFRSKIVITVYTPNAQAELARIEERIQWEQTLRLYLIELQREFDLPMILCGDLNCAPQEIDIHRPKAHRGAPGFSDQERLEFQNLIDAGFRDSFREQHPDRIAYSYFSNFANSRARNVGWRIDHMMVSRSVVIRKAEILGEYFGSDHVPILMESE
jgi:exodeoxyribonuclease-3